MMKTTKQLFESITYGRSMVVFPCGQIVSKMGIFGSQYRKLAASLYGTGISKIPLVKNIHGAISKHTTPEFITIFGYKMFLDKTNME